MARSENKGSDGMIGFGPKWTFTVKIRMKRSGQPETRITKGRIRKNHETGQSYFELKGYKKLKLKVPPYDYIQPQGKHQVIEYANPSPHVFIPIKYDWNSEKYVGHVDPDFLNQLAQQNEEAFNIYKKDSALAAILPFLPVIIVGISAMIMLTILVGALVELSQPVVALSASNAQFMSVVANATEQSAAALETIARIGCNA